MTDLPDPSLGALYRGARQRITDLVVAATADDPGADQRAVPATPGWSVHDVVGHLVAITVGAAGPPPPSGPDDEWTARQVDWARDRTTADLLATWADASAAFEALVDEHQILTAVIDCGTHEHDLRGALGTPGARDDDLVAWAVPLLLAGLTAPTPLVVRTEEGDHPARTRGEGDPVVVTSTRFDTFRWRMGRRSRSRMAAMDWSGDPTPFLDRLAVFGPTADDSVD